MHRRHHWRVWYHWFCYDVGCGCKFHLLATLSLPSFLWSLICERRLTAAELRQQVVETFDVEPQAAEADLQAFLAELTTKGYVDYLGEAPDGR